MKWLLPVIIKREAGMSLIETMISVAVSLIVVIATTQLTLDTLKAQSRVNTVNTIASELTQLERDLSRLNTCSGYLAGMAFNVGGGAQNLPSSPNRMSMKFNGDDRVNLLASQLQPVRRLDLLQISPTVTYERYLANLNFQFETSATAVGGSGLSIRSIPLQVLVNTSTNQIVSCQSGITSMGEFCTLLGGTHDPTGVPQCKLPIFSTPCAGGTVAVGLVPGSIVCAAPPMPPAGPAPPPSRPLGSNYLDLIVVGCTPGDCTCPGHHPMFFGGGPPGSSMTCGGMIQVPPAMDPIAVMACVGPLGAITHCVRLGGVIVRTGFGPCYDCP